MDAFLNGGHSKSLKLILYVTILIICMTVVFRLVIDLFLIVFNTSHIMFFICISLANFHYNLHILSGLMLQ